MARKISIPRLKGKKYNSLVLDNVFASVENLKGIQNNNKSNNNNESLTSEFSRIVGSVTNVKYNSVYDVSEN